MPGGRQVAGYAWSTDTSLVIWDVDSGREVRRLDLGADHHRDLAVSPDGRSFITGHEDCTVRLRDLTTGQEINRVQFAGRHIPRGLAFSPDGRHAACGSWRGFVYLFRRHSALIPTSSCDPFRPKFAPGFWRYLLPPKPLGRSAFPFVA